MANRTKILALSLVALPLVACSGMQEKPTSAVESRVMPQSGASIDLTYVANVEYLARQRGVDVHWVNPPKRLARNP